MGGGRVHQYVRQVWGVDLIEAHLRAALDLPPSVSPSRKPLCTVVNRLLYAPATGRLAAFELDDHAKSAETVDLDVEAEVGEQVDGPDAVFATLLAEVSVSAKDLKRARAASIEVQRVPARVEPLV